LKTCRAVAAPSAHNAASTSAAEKESRSGNRSSRRQLMAAEKCLPRCRAPRATRHRNNSGSIMAGSITSRSLSWRRATTRARWTSSDAASRSLWENVSPSEPTALITSGYTDCACSKSM
jgi:hypothetical protein